MMGLYQLTETRLFASCLAREQGALSGGIEVKGLRVELTGKRLNLRLVQRVGAAGKPLPDVEIVEIKAIIVLVLV
jgi:hypothetical protein